MATLRRRLRSACAELRHSERGIALPMALMITVIGMGFAAVPIVASMNAQHGDSHNQGGNEALAAAEAGAELAVLRQSRMLTESTSSTAPACALESELEANGWCSAYPATPQQFGNATFQYRVRPCYAGAAGACSSVQLPEPCEASEHKDLVQVVSTGAATVAGSEVTRRVQLAACASAVNPALVEKEEELIPAINELTHHTTELENAETRYHEKVTQIEKVKNEPAGYEEIPGATETYEVEEEVPPPDVWGGGQVVGVNWLNMNNNAQVFNGGAGSGLGWVKLVGSANVCGTVTYGTEYSTDNSSSEKAPSGCAAGRTFAKNPTSYPPVTLPSDIATNNSDWRICNESLCHAGADPVGSGVWQRGNISWNASNKKLVLNYNQLTLEGTAPYYLCQLILAGGGSLYSSTTHAIKIYFAPPSACPGLNGSAQLQIANGSYVYGDGANGPLFLFVGSTTAGQSWIELAGGARSEQFVIYAPYSKIVANNGIQMAGAMVGNTLELGGGAELNRYGTFTPPPSEGFLPNEIKTVTKTRPGETIKTPSQYLKELESEAEQIAEEIEGLKTKISEDKTRIKQLEEEIERMRSEGGGAAEPLSRKSFVQCTAASPTGEEAPDTGC